MGANSSAFSILYPRFSNQGFAYINDFGSTDPFSSLNSLGFFSVVRDNAANSKNYKNGVLINSPLFASNFIPNFNFYLLALNSNGSAIAFDTRQISISFAGSGAINQATFYTAVQNLATTLGFNV
jgi:hypothetical protein